MKLDVQNSHGEDRYRQILEAAPDAMLVVDRAGAILFANRQATALFCYEPSELLGHKLEMLLPERFRASHGGHLTRYFAAPTPRSMGSGVELFGRRKDGKEINIEVSLSPVRSSGELVVSAAIRDISERKTKDFQIALTADRLANAVESIEDPLAIFDAKDRLVLCNRAYQAIAPQATIGMTRHEIDAASATALVTNRVDAVLEDSLEGADTLRPFDVTLLDGRTLRVTNRRTGEGGLVQTAWDITEQVKHEQELMAARTAAELGSEAKSEFLASMSHELRTPLNAILGFAQLLERDKKEPLSTRHKDRVAHIVKGGEHLLRLIDDILDLSRIESGRVSISTEPVNVAEVLVELRAALTPMAARYGIALTVLVNDSTEQTVEADRTRLTQILMNFASNALKYNRLNGAVSMTMSNATEGMVRVTVTDTGMGIPEDRQASLFQPFQRAGQETGPIEGTGIGLVITKRLAELMGGRVGFLSTYGEGSQFWVEIPVHVVRQRPSTHLSSQETKTLHLGGVRKHVVYVEDNPANVAFMRDILGDYESIELSTAPTAEMGIELVRKKQPQLVIMDINLPGMSGLDALTILRDDVRTRHIPIVALTAAASERDRTRGMKAGFYRYLTKPVNVNELIGALEELLAPVKV
jgi:PAS domain S-box-containing protein